MSVSPPPVDIRFEIRLNPEVRQAYEEIYSGDGIRQLDSFYRWLLGLLQPLPGRRLLDVACGEGVLPNFGRQLYGLEAVGIDLSQQAMQIARNEGAGAFCVAGGEQLPFATARFDYVTRIGSPEHFPKMQAGVAGMARVLRPDGLACILVPNTYSLLNNILKACTTGWSTIDMQPLQRYLARAEWAMLLEGSGLQVVQTFKYDRETPDTLQDWLWYLRHPRALVRLALSPYIPLNLATCFVYLCRPIQGGHP